MLQDGDPQRSIEDAKSKKMNVTEDIGERKKIYNCYEALTTPHWQAEFLTFNEEGEDYH